MTLANESVVADVRLVKLLSRDSIQSTWLGEGSEGRKLAVHVADGEAATPDVQAMFRERALALASWTETRKSEGVLRVPTQALRYTPEGAARSDPAKPRIWVLRGSQHVPVQVEPGLNDDDYVEIRSGDLRAGDQVIVAERAAPVQSSPPPRL